MSRCEKLADPVARRPVTYAERGAFEETLDELAAELEDEDRGSRFFGVILEVVWVALA